jgi:predicted DsbA family dithiol-disulfide isomerase
LSLQWTAFPLHPETPEEGRSLASLFAGRHLDLPAMLAHLQGTAAALGLPFTARTMTYNSRRAQELAKYAEAQGRGPIFHRLVFEAYFARGENIARHEVLREIAGAAGLDPPAAEEVVRQGRYKGAVDRDWQRCRAMGITAVPTFHMNGRQVVGAPPPGAIEALARAAGAAPRA